MLMLARTADNNTATPPKASVKDERGAEVLALISALAVLQMGINVRSVLTVGLDLCTACERDADIGGALFTNTAVAVVTARHPHTGSTFRSPICPGHAEQVITEHLDRGRHVALEVPTMPAIPTAPVAQLATA